MKNKLKILICVFLVLALACDKKSKVEKLIEEVDVDLNIERFDELFSNVSPASLEELKEAYPFMFSKQFSDSLWISRIHDSLQIQLRNEVSTTFENFKEKDEISRLFQHIKYHDKTFNVPRVITVTNDIDYRNNIIVTDTIVLIALDTYLGSEHEFYGGIQKYIKQNFKREQIVVDLANAYANKKLYSGKGRTLLDDMINSGKLLYFKDVMIPFKSDAQKISYTEEQLQWAKANESNIWRHFVEKELLYDTNPKLSLTYTAPAPFTKFGLELDRESPGRLGAYIGWQIIRAYMKNNTVGLNKMMTTDSEIIFNNSKFKPKK